MTVHIIALDGTTTVTDPTADMLSAWAWERHLADCRECSHGLEYCPAGHAYLKALAPRTDLPGYPAL